MHWRGLRNFDGHLFGGGGSSCHIFAFDIRSGGDHLLDHKFAGSRLLWRDKSVGINGASSRDGPCHLCTERGLDQLVEWRT